MLQGHLLQAHRRYLHALNLAADGPEGHGEDELHGEHFGTFVLVEVA